MANEGDKPAAVGSWGLVAFACRRNKTLPAEEFYDGLPLSDQAKVMSLFRRMAEAGRIINREKFKQVEGDIFEFKSFRARISCYRDGNSWYLLHGFDKKGDKWPEGQLIRARNLLVEHRGH
jgi:hypothetical protein